MTHTCVGVGIECAICHGAIIDALDDIPCTCGDVHVCGDCASFMDVAPFIDGHVFGDDNISCQPGVDMNVGWDDNMIPCMACGTPTMNDTCGCWK